MKKHYLLLLSMLLLAVASVQAAMFSTSPNPMQQSSKDIKIYFDPAQCDVAELKTASEIYAHIGVTLPSAPSTWDYVVGSWADKQAKKKFVKQADGRWMLNIGEIDTYFGLPAGTKVAKIAIIALNAAGSAQTADVFLDVAEEGYAMSLTSNPEDLVISKATNFTFTVGVTQPSTITIKVGNQVIGTASNATTLTKSHNFTVQGSFNEVTATATNGKETISKSLTVAYPSASTAMNYPGGVPKQGAIRQADGSVLFCIAAPSKTSAILVGSWDDFKTLDKNVMKYQDYNGYRYFWTRVNGLADRQYHSYYYLLDGVTKVADPYAKLILDPYSDKWLPSGIWNEPMPQYPYEKIDGVVLAVYRSDIDDYNWDSATTNFKVPDHNSMVIYELLLRDFTGDGSDQDGKHFGTISEARKKIPYLKDLGINCVELLPVMEFNGNNSWGYNTNAYMALDKAYGSPKDLRDFVAECHRNGIAVVLDIVFNQTDGLHPWYQMYPVGSNPFYNKEAPHKHNVLNDLRQDYPLVEQHWADVLRYWMEAYKVDGFRFDLVKGLGDNDSYTPSNTDSRNQSRINRMKRLNDVITSVKADGIHINELLGQNSEENDNFKNGAQMGWQNLNYTSYQNAMGFAAGSGDVKNFYPGNGGRTFGAAVGYAESHDEVRIGYQMKTFGANDDIKYTGAHPGVTGVQRLGSVAAYLLMAPGAKMIWQFGEIGADDKLGSDLEKLRAIEPKWDQFENENRKALFENYQALCYLRLKNPELFDGTASYVTGTFSNTLNSARWIKISKGEKEVLAVINPQITRGKATVRITGIQKLSANNYHIVTKAHQSEPTITFANGSATAVVPGNSFVVIATNSVASTEDVSADMTATSVNVYGANGEIIIEGDYETAEVYDLQGRMSTSLQVPAGVYVVRVDGNAYKVAVK